MATNVHGYVYHSGAIDHRTVYTPTPWQRNPLNIRTDADEPIQYWRDGDMITAVSSAAAQDLVRRGKAFVITSYAIGALDEKGRLAS